MREFFRQRPWMYVVLLLGALVLSSLTMLAISLAHPPQSAVVVQPAGAR